MAAVEAPPRPTTKNTISVKSFTQESFGGIYVNRTCTPTRMGAPMKSIAIHATLLTGLGALMFMGTVATTVPAAAKCMIDEGNGRYTPCEALVKQMKTKKKKG